MGAFIAQQPNGLYCRFSTVVDCVTDKNMTREDYIELCVFKWGSGGKETAIDTLDNYLHPFSEVVDRFVPNNMTQKEFNKELESMGYNI